MAGMMQLDAAGEAQLCQDEGESLTAYPDPLSPLGKACAAARLDVRRWRKLPAALQALDGKPWTIGNGCTGAGIGPDTVWTQDQVDRVRRNRVAIIGAQLSHESPWMLALDPVRQGVWINIAFNVGVQGLEHWPKTLADGQRGDIAAVARDLLTEGKWNHQVGQRADRLAEAYRTGRWPGTVASDATHFSPPPEPSAANPKGKTMTDASIPALAAAAQTPSGADSSALTIQHPTVAGAILMVVAGLAPEIAPLFHTTAATVNSEAGLMVQIGAQVVTVAGFVMAIFGHAKTVTAAK